MKRQQTDRGSLRYRSKEDAAGWVKAGGIELFDVAISDGAYRLLCVLRWHVGGNDRAWPGQLTLAEEMGISSRQVQRLVVELKAHGLLTVEQRGQGRTADYFLEPLPGPMIARSRVPGWVDKSVVPGAGLTRTSVLKQTSASVLSTTETASPSIEERSIEGEAGEGGIDAGSPLATLDAPPPYNLGPYSPYVAGVVMDVGRETLRVLDVPRLVLDYMSVWAGSGLAESVFVELLYQARKELRKTQSTIKEADRPRWFAARVAGLVKEETQADER